jgi:hypothetical protein
MSLKTIRLETMMSELETEQQENNLELQDIELNKDDAVIVIEKETVVLTETHTRRIIPSNNNASLTKDEIIIHTEKYQLKREKHAHLFTPRKTAIAKFFLVLIAVLFVTLGKIYGTVS